MTVFALLPFLESHGSSHISRSSGVAPLYVHFHTEYSEEDIPNFHEFDYTWDFGDPGSGNWGTTGLPRNKAKGAMAAYVYETPGNYTSTLTVRDQNGVVGTESFAIEVLDPDVVFEGENTICVNPAGDNDFSHAPAGALHVATDDLTEVAPLSAPGTRILFKRGASWTISGELDNWNRNNSGPVLISAYGPGENPDELGIYQNNPLFKIIDDGVFIQMNNIQDWRFEQLAFDAKDGGRAAFSGTFSMQRILFNRLKVKGGTSNAIGWSHYNQFGQPIIIKQMAIVSCDILGGESMAIYVGAEQFALLGNRIADASRSHVVRVWQGYRSVISNNLISGASLHTDMGRHALKIHGPGYSTFNESNSYGDPDPGTIRLRNRTEFSVISDNVFGQSGPWPVAIGTQDAFTDSKISNLIFERNRIIASYGTAGPRNVDVALILWVEDSTVRNNVIDGSGPGSGFTGIRIERRGSEPIPAGNRIYHNTIYMADNVSGHNRRGIQLSSDAHHTMVKNNLVVFTDPSPQMSVAALDDSGVLTESEGNILKTHQVLSDPDNPLPLLRDYSALPQFQQTLKQALPVYSIYHDIYGNQRNDSGYNTFGAFEFDTEENQPPVLESIGNRSVQAGTELRFHIHAEDADGDTLSYSASGEQP